MMDSRRTPAPPRSRSQCQDEGGTNVPLALLGCIVRRMRGAVDRSRTASDKAAGRTIDKDALAECPRKVHRFVPVQRGKPVVAPLLIVILPFFDKQVHENQSQVP